MVIIGLVMFNIFQSIRWNFFFQVTAAEIVNAEKIFGSLSLITTSQLSQFRLMSLVGETRQKALSNAKDQKKQKQSKEHW